MAFHDAYAKVNNGEQVTDGFSGYSFDGWLVFLDAAKKALKEAKPGTTEFRTALNKRHLLHEEPGRRARDLQLHPRLQLRRRRAQPRRRQAGRRQVDLPAVTRFPRGRLVAGAVFCPKAACGRGPHPARPIAAGGRHLAPYATRSLPARRPLLQPRDTMTADIAAILAVDGIATGAIYVLIALGFVLIFAVTPGDFRPLRRHRRLHRADRRSP